jgi:hypothetical protein
MGGAQAVTPNDVVDGLGADEEPLGEDSVVPAPSWETITVELLTHWSAGNRVALLLNVMSAHYFKRKSAVIHYYVPALFSRCINLHHRGQKLQTG